MHFYLKVEGRGAWVFYSHFLLLLYFVNVLLIFVNFLKGEEGMVFFPLLKKK